MLAPQDETEEKTGGFKRFRGKMGPITEVETDRLSISEFNTRCKLANEGQVLSLMRSMEENGFIPKCAPWVNAITDDGTREGTIIQYRLVAGRHRHEAARRAGLTHIPCQIFFNLKDEEECELDIFDNRLDESHIPSHFLEEAEHCRYLYETKGWSYRKIGKNKGISHMTAARKIKIAEIPEEAKMIVRGVTHGLHLFSERHFRDICELSEPHIIAICEEIATKGRQAERGEKDETGNPVTPMKQADIKKRVDELLELAKEATKLSGTPEAPSIHLNLSENVQLRDEQQDMSCTEKAVLTEQEETPEEPAPGAIPNQAPEHVIENQQIRDLVYRSLDKNSRGLNIDRCVRWLKNSGLVRELGQTAYIVLRKMEEYDLWYRAQQDEPFFFGPDKDPFAHIADQAGIEKEHLQKRSLPYLKKRRLS